MHLNLFRGYMTNCGQALAALEPKLLAYPRGTVATGFQQPTYYKKVHPVPFPFMYLCVRVPQYAMM